MMNHEQAELRELLLKETLGADQARLECARKRLHMGDPLHYVLGECTLLGTRFRVDRRAYRPSPRSEALVTYALGVIDRPLRILDVGTGCGWIAILLKQRRPDCQIMGVDLDAGAIALAHENRRIHGVDVSFCVSDFARHVVDFVPDLVIANLPYGDPARSAARCADNASMPQIALYHPGGEFAAFAELADSLRERGWRPRCIVECGTLEDAQVAAYLPSDMRARLVRCQNDFRLVDGEFACSSPPHLADT